MDFYSRTFRGVWCLEFVLSNQQEGSFIKYPFMSKNYVDSLVVQIELVFRCSNVHIYLIFHKISLGLNSYVHRSTVSAPKSEDEHLSFSTSFLLLCLLFLFIGIFLRQDWIPRNIQRKKIRKNCMNCFHRKLFCPRYFSTMYSTKQRIQIII